MYKLVLFDIDGVLTNGKLLIDESGQELKQIDFRDIDAIHAFSRAGFQIGAITKENTPIVSYFKKRFPWNYFYSDVSDKYQVMCDIAKQADVSLKEIVYMGDGFADILAIQYAGLGVCPANAIKEAKSVADCILKQSGGDGAVLELFQYLRGQYE